LALGVSLHIPLGLAMPRQAACPSCTRSRDWPECRAIHRRCPRTDDRPCCPRGIVSARVRGGARGCHRGPPFVICGGYVRAVGDEEPHHLVLTQFASSM
jgi:hypothetical protein